MSDHLARYDRDDYQPPERALPSTPWQNAMEWAADNGVDLGDPLPMPPDVALTVKLQGLEHHLRYAIKQAGPGGVVITDEERRKPAPPYREIRLDGAIRLVSVDAGS